MSKIQVQNPYTLDNIIKQTPNQEEKYTEHRFSEEQNFTVSFHHQQKQQGQKKVLMVLILKKIQN